MIATPNKNGNKVSQTNIYSLVLLIFKYIISNLSTFSAKNFTRKLRRSKRNAMFKYASDDYYSLKIRSKRSNFMPGRWAESVHLYFTRDGFDRSKWSAISKNGWMLENTIVVHKSVKRTFFETVGYGGGYAGIQQLPSRSCGMSKGKTITYLLYGIFQYSSFYD